VQVLTIQRQGEPTSSIFLDRERYLVGRGPGNDLRFPDDLDLARYHLLFENTETGWVIADLSGTGETRLNGEKMDRTVRLNAGDTVEAGQLKLYFAAGEPEYFQRFTTSLEIGVKRPVGSGGASRAETSPAISTEEKTMVGGATSVSASFVPTYSHQQFPVGGVLSDQVLTLFERAAGSLDGRDSSAKLESQILSFVVDQMSADGGILAMLDGELLQRRLVTGEPGDLPILAAQHSTRQLVSLALEPGSFGHVDPRASAMLVPLSQAGRARGVIYISRKHQPFSLSDLQLISLYANLAAQVLERAHLQEHMERLAYFDPVTTLPNRARLQELVDERLRLRLPVSLAILRLDRLNLVRTTLGREFADRLMQRLTEHYRTLLLEGEFLCRPDYSEFAILIPETEGSDPLEARMQQLAEQVSAPVWISGKQIFPTCSIGVATLDTRHRVGEEIIRDAEIAASRGKAAPGAKFCMFEENMHRRLMRIQQVETALRRALTIGEQITVAFQPIIRMESGELAGFEVLVRWNHPEFGFIQPSEFIPLAEETGLISGVGRIVLDQACQQLAEWQRRHPQQPLFLAVNISPMQLSDEAFPGELASAIREAGVDPSCLVLEITESAMIDDPEHAVQILNELKKLGVRLALDDLGTGYSSFQYLYKLPLDILKIDRSFVVAMRTQEETHNVVRLITDLGRLLRLDVVAEGVEQMGDFEVMRRMGCDLGQGYLFGLPVSAGEATLIVEGSHPWKSLVFEQVPTGAVSRIE
jgi:diguanylate cyclase (GGDEF)-like protein